jgi:glutathione S-transferase
MLPPQRRYHHPHQNLHEGRCDGYPHAAFYVHLGRAHGAQRGCGRGFLEPGFRGINASQQVPVLEDGDFRLTESSAILKYLAEKTGSASYPKDLRGRARVNERMDWFNTGFYRELGYGVIYPQIFQHYKRADPAVQQAHLVWGREKARRWLTILDQDIIGPNAYVCGEQLTIADYLGIGMVSLGEVTRFDYAEWPNLSRWIETMKARPSWQRVHQTFYTHFVVAYENASFVTLR